MKKGLFLLFCSTLAFAEQNSDNDESQQIETDQLSNSIQQTKQELDSIQVIGQENKTEVSKETKKLLDMAGTGGDPLVSLQSLPGITSDSRIAGEPAVRGAGPDANTYRIDGMPVPYLFHIYPYSIVSGQNIQNFDIQTGAFTAQYGGATSSVINIDLRQPKSQPFKTEFELGMMNMGLFTEGEFVEGNPFYAGIRQSTIGFFAKPLVGALKKNDPSLQAIEHFPNSYDLFGKYHKKIDDNNSLDIGTVGSLDLVLINSDQIDDLEEEFEITVQTSYLSSYLNWNHENQNGNALTVNFGNAYARDLIDISFPDYDDFLVADIIENRLVLGADYQNIQHSSHQFNLGIEYQNLGYELENKISNWGECDNWDDENEEYSDCGVVSIDRDADLGNNHIISGYLEDQWFVSDSFTLTSGVHFSWDNMIDNMLLQPRVKLGYDNYDGLTSFIAVGRHHLMPETWQLSEKFGNPKLTNSLSDHFVIGAKKEFYSGWNIKAESYFKKTSNIIQDPITFGLEGIDDIGFTFLTQYNYPRTTTNESYGLELFLEKELSNKFSGWLALSLSESIETDDNTGIQYLSDYDRPVVLDLVANYKFNERWKTSIKYNLKSGKVYSPYESVFNDNITADAETLRVKNGRRTDNHKGVDLRIEYNNKKPNSHLMVYLDIINVLNQTNVGKKYDDSYSYTDPDGYTYYYEDSYEEPIEFYPYILPLLGMKYTF